MTDVSLSGDNDRKSSSGPLFIQWEVHTAPPGGVEGNQLTPEPITCQPPDD